MLTTVVKIVLKESKHPLSGVKVSLFDRDSMSADDLIGTGRTSKYGKVYFKYSLKKYSDLLGDESSIFWPNVNNLRPDLYVKVYNKDGKVVLSTRAQTRENAYNRTIITVQVAEEEARQYGLIVPKPHRTPKEKNKQWINHWKEVMAKLPPDAEPPVDFCFTRTLLDIIEGLDNPSNDLQKRAAKMLDGKVTKDDIKKVGELAKHGIKAIDELEIPNTMCDSSDDSPRDLAERLTKPGGPLYDVAQNHYFFVPPPDQNLPSPQAGLPITHLFSDWNEACEKRYTFCPGTHCDLSPEALEQMDEYSDPDSLVLLTPPSINDIQIWDGEDNHYARIREAYPNSKELHILDLNCIQGGGDKTLNMNISLQDDECLYMVEDPDSSGKQILATDIQPGQKIVFNGSGFINETATLHVEFKRWGGPDENGRLVPEATSGFSYVNGLSDIKLDVYGNYGQNDNNKDHIYFDWPDSGGEPGLYKIWLEFKNVDQIPTSANQNPDTCELEINTEGRVKSQVIWFTVIPSLVAKNIRINKTEIKCIDEKDPEYIWPINLSDDINLQVTRTLNTYRGLKVPEPKAYPPINGNHKFWNDGDSWQFLENIFPEDDSFHALTIEYLEHQQVITQFLVTEVLGESDRLLMTAIAIIISVVILVLIVALIVALIATGVIVITGTAATITAAIVGFLFGTAYSAISTAVVTLINSLTGADPVAFVQLPISGSDLAQRLSPFKIHRLFSCPVDQPSSETAELQTRITEETTSNDDLVYTFTCKNVSIKSEYSLKITVDVLHN